MRGALAPLDLLLRLADQEMGRQPKDYRAQIDTLINSVREKNLTLFADTIEPLVDAFPLVLPASFGEGEVASVRQLNVGQSVHQQLCAHCHDNPASGVERPASALFREARHLSRSVFLARMLIGVRGDRITGIDNPLSDTQIGALIRWYRSSLSNGLGQ